MRKYAIVVTTYGRPDFLEKCLDSLPQDVIHEVVDTKFNGWPLAKAWNYAVKKYCVTLGFDAVIITNDDVIFEPDTAELLVDCLLHRQYEEKLPLNRECLVVKAWDKKCRQNYHVDELKNGWRNWFNEGWFCFATSARLFDLIGEFDENFDPCYGEDTDMAYRIYSEGYGAISYPGVWHESSGSTKFDPERAAFVEKAKFRIARYFKEKWGEVPNRGPLYEKLFYDN